MGRSRHADLGSPPGDEWEIFELMMALSGVMEPDDFIDEQLEYAWTLYRDEIMKALQSA